MVMEIGDLNHVGEHFLYLFLLTYITLIRDCRSAIISNFIHHPLGHGISFVHRVINNHPGAGPGKFFCATCTYSTTRTSNDCDLVLKAAFLIF